MKRVYIMGGSGIGMIAASIVDDLDGYAVAGFINDVVPAGTDIGRFRRFPVVGTTNALKTILRNKDAFVVNAFVGMQKQSQAYDAFKSLQLPLEKFVSLIAPRAAFSPEYVRLGHGVLLAPCAQVSPDAVIGNHCRLLGGSFVGHDSTLDECVSVATNAVVGANVHVERGVHIGSNATIREKLVIGEFSLVGMGAVVVKDVPPRSVVVGNPAKVLKTL